MITYSDPFGGSTLQAAQVAYRAVALSASIVTVWPPFATAANYLARIMDVTPSAGSLTITLPEATLQSQGWDVFFTNKGASTYTVLDAAGGTVMTVAAGQVKYIYLTSNTTDAGVWSVVIMGVGSSNLDAAALAGYGLRAITTTLNTVSQVVPDNTTPRTIATSDLASTYVWTGGTGVYNLPVVASMGDDFYFEVRNQGTGVLTLTPTGGEFIDGSANIALQLNESCFVHSGPTAWYTVGRGRNTQFDFTQLVKPVTGGTTVLTLTEAANVVQTYTGVLASAQTVVVPGVVQVYYMRNQTTGAFNFRVQTPTPGAFVDIPSGENAILFSDGTNVYNATTTVTNVSTFPALTVSPRSSNTKIVVADRGSMLQYTGTFTQTFDPAATLGSGFYVDVQNVGTGVITFDADGTETFNTGTGARTTIRLYPGEGYRIVGNAIGFDLVGRSSVAQLGPAVAASGLTLDVENGFADTEFQRIEIAYWTAAVTSTQLAIRVKKSGAYITSANYSIGISYANGGTPVSLTGQTYGFASGSNTALALNSGVLTVVRPSSSSGQQLISIDVATPTDTSPKNNRAMIGIAESTNAAIEGIRFLDSGGGNLSGSFVVTGYRG